MYVDFILHHFESQMVRNTMNSEKKITSSAVIATRENVICIIYIPEQAILHCKLLEADSIRSISSAVATYVIICKLHGELGSCVRGVLAYIGNSIQPGREKKI